jgi:hypothetical protein
VRRLLRSGLQLWRLVAGRGTKTETIARRVLKRSEMRNKGEFQTRSTFVLRRRAGNSEYRFGIYARGSCDLVSVVECGPHLRDEIPGDYAILKEGFVAQRSDILLQSLEQLPSEAVNAVVENLKLPLDYFRPKLFEANFEIPDHSYLGEFPKSVVVLSVNPDLTRTAYRHREHGLLVDPGGWWLDQSMEQVLARLKDGTTWFVRNFEKMGKMTLEDFHHNFGRVVSLIHERTGATVLVFNSLVVEPGSLVHNYQLSQNPHNARRLEFMLALIELSARLDFAIVDVDRVLKREGISMQADFAHFSAAQRAPVVDEVVRVLREREVLKRVRA